MTVPEARHLKRLALGVLTIVNPVLGLPRHDQTPVSAEAVTKPIQTPSIELELHNIQQSLDRAIFLVQSAPKETS